MTVFDGHYLMVIGMSLLSISAFGMDDPTWKEFWSGTGKTMLAGGVFAVILKSYQFMGIFKEELSKIIYDAKFLNLRSDLPEVWVNVSKVLFKNKFPKINSLITQDVKNIYFPVKDVVYYDKYRQFLRIKLIDPLLQKIEVTQTSEYTIYPTEPLAETPLQLNNWLHYESDSSEVSFKIVSFRVNGEEITGRKDFRVRSAADPNNKTLKTIVEATLSGSDTYKINCEIVKTYSLNTDNIITLAKEGIIHNLNVRVETSGVKATFKSAGTLKPFAKVPVGSAKDYREYDYEGIIYPKQGYHIFLQYIS